MRRLALSRLTGVEAPAGVELTTWTGAGEPPVDLTAVGFYCGPYEKVPDPIVGLAAGMPALEVVQVLSAGVDRVADRLLGGVTLCNGRGLHDASTSELAVGLMIAAQRDLAGMVGAQARQQWAPPTRNLGLTGRTVLIVGYGSVGAAIERRLSGFGVHVLRAARHAREGVHPVAELDGLLPLADVVVLAVPLTAETEGLMDAARLALMRPGALLVNVARGAVVDTAALLDATASGRLRAALDVTDPEPLPPGHPLWTTPGVLITPHVGGGIEESVAAARALVSRQLVHWAAGEPLENVVRPALPSATPPSHEEVGEQAALAEGRGPAGSTSAVTGALDSAPAQRRPSPSRSGRPHPAGDACSGR
ncbi:2-hydroxyacid dehydrogenase [Modestobacter italicus]|uniref:2-hydroxyacid dehydrogenase n=1 Tax=Modestobacter italicus (strain DSM 44449 / CECT 9708 / BC 501) TaxID=2732864 RepID=UPI001C970486|nr:2-hydroxyacid dehydrogenase [Modestobacter italicus]